MLLHAIRCDFESRRTPMVISGRIGPRGDGYNPANFMSDAEAESYHQMQAQTFHDADADMVTAVAMT